MICIKMWIFVWYAKSTLIVLQSGADTLINAPGPIYLSLPFKAPSSFEMAAFHGVANE